MPALSFPLPCVAAPLQVELLAAAPYSARDPLRSHALGMPLQRQQGMHAIGSDRRHDFDAWPGQLTYTPPGVDVFSESERGGEYMVLRWNGDAGGALGDDGALAPPARRRSWNGHKKALESALHLRKQLLYPEHDPCAIEQAAWCMLGLLQAAPAKSAVQATPALHALYASVLERMAAEHCQALGIAELADGIGRTPLRFLREFTSLVGMTPHAFLVEQRLQTARALMASDAGPLAHIALDSGFAHQSHMGLAFRKHLGMTPGQYQAGLRSGRATAVTLRLAPG